MKKIRYIDLFLYLILFCFAALPVHAQGTNTAPKITKPQKVFVGFHLNQIVNVDLKLNIYSADFYVWFRWQGDIDPTETYELMNAYERWGETSISEREEKRVFKDGWNHKEVRVEVQFYSPFYFEPYPLDQQILKIQIEDKSHPKNVLQYVADSENSSYNSDLFIPGWKVEQQKVDVIEHKYHTNFGQLNNIKDETYSRVVHELHISRHPQSLHFFKLFLPVLIILVTVFMIYIIPISFFEARIEISITGLLSLIALQMVMSDTLPPVGYLTLTDKIYYFAYFLVMCGMVETVLVYFTQHKSERRAKLIDRISAGVMLFGTPLMLLLFFTILK